jgi:ADP-heptose:LPS heptosyltransferase
MSAENRTSRIQPSQVESVLVFRPDSLGDVVLFSGALRHIRARYPQAGITLCVRRYVANYLELCPYVDRTLVWEDFEDSLFPFPLRGLTRLLLRSVRYPIPKLVLRILAAMMKLPLKAQVAIFPVRSPSWGQHVVAAALASEYSAALRGDYCNQSRSVDDAVEDFYTERFEVSQERRWEPELSVTRDFLNRLGMEVSVEDIWPQTWTATEDREQALNMMPQTKGSLVVGIVPGAGRPARIYPPEKFAQAFARVSEHSFSFAVFGTSEERDLCGDLAQRLCTAGNTREARNLGGQTTIRQLAECVRLCDMVVSTDTGSLHLATALGKPTVGIVGGGHFGRFYPWGNPDLNRMVSRRMDCYYCRWACRYEVARCIHEIEPSAIAGQVRGLIQALGSIDARAGSHSAKQV